MFSMWCGFALLVCLAGPAAHALTGSDVSPITPLETLSPTLHSLAIAGDRSVSVAFSEPMHAPSIAARENYIFSGLGLGTLTPLPSGVAGGPQAMALSWESGEMRDGMPIVLVVTGAQDAAGNPIHASGNSAESVGTGMAPEFNDLAAHPAQAAAGDCVIISFTVSETLQAPPEALVNGHAAILSSIQASGYSFTYTVQESDLLGPAVIDISGVDLAGNVGGIVDDTMLAVVFREAELPLPVWPQVMALLATLGCFALMSRRMEPPRPWSGWTSQPSRRGGMRCAALRPEGGAVKRRGWSCFARLFVPALTCSFAFAQAPVVSNVTMMQRPNASGTQVDIHYDLAAPNGPCAISVSLSKDGGADNYVFPASALSGDIAGVTTGAGKHIVWDIRADYPEENLPLARIRVTADDGLVQHTLTYLAGPRGSIAGETPQTVAHGGSGTPVTAVPDPNCHFVHWSDGVLTATRQDTLVAANKTVTAFFAINTYAIACLTEGEGSCAANPPVVLHGGISAITVTPGVGWHLTSLMDSEEGPKSGSYITTPVTANRVVTATFGINTYTVACHAIGSGSCVADPVSVPHGGTSAITVTPAAGWHLASLVDSEEGLKTGSYITSPILSNRLVAATFAVNTYTLSYTAGPNGMIQGNTLQTIVHGGSAMPVTAVAHPGHMFAQWSDGVTTAVRQDTGVTANLAVTASFAVVPLPWISNFSINGGAATAQQRDVTLDHSAAYGPTEYMASESASFSGASWAPYAGAPQHALSFGVGTRVVYFKARNASGESNVVSDTIFLAPDTVSVNAGTFTMGRLNSGMNDDTVHGTSDELPQHAVTLSAYRIGRFEVTNKEYCDVLNWAFAQGHLKDALGNPWQGTGDIYAGGPSALYLIVAITHTTCNIQYADGVFSSKTRVGLPGTTNYSMDTHPMLRVSWYGAAAYCFWLSQWQGLTPCYDMNTESWPLVLPPPTLAGYRLPTEAEWERAAAWEAAASRHWIYSFMASTLTGRARANYFLDPGHVNPLGLTVSPFTSPVGWFNGINVSPNGGIVTVNSVSDVGAYDMSGNVWEWCHDREGLYTATPKTNPLGPGSGATRTLRGGAWNSHFYRSRSAQRNGGMPTITYEAIGFRIARS